MPRAPILAALTLGLALAACGGEQASTPDAVSPGEAKALDDAASMLDERRLPPEALPTDAPTDGPPEPAATPAEMTGDAAKARR